MKFKLKRYNMGGYLRYDDGGIFDEYQNDPMVRASTRRQDSANRTADTIAQGAQAIPVYGQLVAAGIKTGQAIGKATKDPYGIYTSKAGEVIDNAFNPVKGISDFTNMHDANDFVNHATFGLLGTNRQQAELRKAKDLAERKVQNNQYSQEQELGARSRAAVGGFQAAPYGKLGIKLPGIKRNTTRFSCGCRH